MILAFDQAPTLYSVIKLAFFPYPIVRVGGTFDLVLEVVALGRQELRDLIDARALTAPYSPDG
jgi:hypothetical protein